MQPTNYEDRDTRQVAQAALNSIGDGVLTTDVSGHITYLNDVAEQLTGWSRGEAIGRPLTEVFGIIDCLTPEHARNPSGFADEQDQIMRLTGSCLLVRRDGSESAISDSAAPIRDPNGKVAGTVHVFRNVSEARALALRLAYEAHHDTLTGLPNRILFKDRVIQAINAAHRRRKQLAVLFVDVDDFKLVNDSLGHAVGDALLQSVAKRLVTCLRSTDTVSRHGGDEFVILLSEIEDAKDAAKIAQKLLAALEPPHMIGESDLQVTVSIGISIYPDHGQVGEVLIHKADAAMYQAKKDHGAAYRFLE
jgi:diguanylate cyclase (GGDEF)-like protein/PAS domain S-box-containing protein